MSRQIARHTPFLRRYARALTGSQAAGDEIVKRAIEALIAGEIVLRGDLAPKAALYAAMHQALGDAYPASAVMTAVGADRHLQTLSPDQRAALLLTSMEGLTRGEAAGVLRREPADLDALLDDADVRLRQQLSARVLIIEDEPIIGLDLTRLVLEVGHEVVGVAATRDEAVALARSSRPGLVLADVRLADGSSGIDAASDILKGFDIPVIFITAFPEHLLTGDRPEPAFMITKPFREEMVKALIGQALFFHEAHGPADAPA